MDREGKGGHGAVEPAKRTGEQRRVKGGVERKDQEISQNPERESPRWGGIQLQFQGSGS